MVDKPDIKELAVCAWRLEKWLDNLNADRKMAAKSALRGIKKYISACGIELKDPVGSKFDPGLAIEVVNNEAEEADEDALIIIETLEPYIYQDGELIQHARVIIGTEIKETKENNAVLETILEGKVVEEAPQHTSSEVEDENAESDEIEFDAKDIEKVMAYAKIL